MLDLYIETVFQPKQPSSKQCINFTVPRANGSYDRSKNIERPKRTDRLAIDDKTHASEYLATSSSVHASRFTSYPHSFCWRVISKSKLLEIQVADFARNEHDQPHDKVINFEFQDAISPRGISVCDGDDGSSIHFFVLTEANEVFDLRLQTAFFAGNRLNAKEAGSIFTPIPASALFIDTAWQVHAENPTSLFVTFVTGRLQRWTRSKEHQTWSYTTYDDKGWTSSLLSVMSRKASADIEYNGKRIAHSTPNAVVCSGNYVFTSCLNHSLRTWHLQSGKLVDDRDLLNKARPANNRIQLNPTEPSYAHFLMGGSNHERTLLTYSPLDGGSVKFWTIGGSQSDDADSFSMEDRTPSTELKLPDPDPSGNTVWSLAGLATYFDKYTKQWQMWITWRNNNYHKAYTLDFNLSNVVDAWQQDWVAVHSTPVRIDAPSIIGDEPQDLAEKWSNFILFPDRYATSVIETTLYKYQQASSIRLSSEKRSAPLRQRLVETISQQVKPSSSQDTDIDHDNLVINTDYCWRQFWRMLESLNETRYAPLSLSCDGETGSVWLMMAGACCTIRECNDLELLKLNSKGDLKNIKSIAQQRWPYRKVIFSETDASAMSVIIQAASEFYQAFPLELTSEFLECLDEDLYSPTEIPAAQRVVDIFNLVDLANAVPPDVEKSLMKTLDSLGGSTAITTARIDAILKVITHHRSKNRHPTHVKTRLGVTIAMKATLDEIAALRDMYLSLIALVVFTDETDHFDPGACFSEVMEKLSLEERNLWMATHFRSANNSDEDKPVSVLEDIYGHIIRPASMDHYPMTYLLTRHIADNLDFISGTQYISNDEATVYLQCNLLKHENIDLAKDFLRFQPSTPWSTYIKGRLSLEIGSYDEAYESFQQASQALATGRATEPLHEISSGYLTNDQASSFFDGLARYYEHILSLFEDKGVAEKAIDVAHLALNAVSADKAEPVTNFTQGITLRLFNAELQCSKHDSAFQTLTTFTDAFLQRRSCIDLINHVLNTATSSSDMARIVTELESLPFQDHPQMACQLDTHLSSLASKQTTLPSGTLWLSSSKPDYISILHALRLTRGDHRGATRCLFDRLRVLQRHSRSRHDPSATSLRHALLALINALTCVEEDEAYIIATVEQDPRAQASRKRPAVSDASAKESEKRRKVVITLDDFRAEYQKVLDKCSRIERGDFEFGGDDEGSDEDVDMMETSILEGGVSTNGVSHKSRLSLKAS